MKKSWKFAALGAAAATVAALIPFKVKYDDESGEFEYRSFLLGVHKKTNPETGNPNVTISLFNLPECSRKAEETDYTDDVPEDEGVLILDESELVTPDAPAVPEAPAEPEPPAEPETPAESEPAEAPKE